MLDNVKHSPKKGRGVKEALAVMVIVGNMGSRIELGVQIPIIGRHDK
nr:hypothetical protein [Pedobacter frigiditerrae]